MVAGPELCGDGDRMWLDRPAPDSEMVGTASELLSPGTIPIEDG
jgi:hypothetical protein